MAIIAKIKLANGQVGYYDDYSKIYLTPSRPEAYITSGTNLYQIKKSIKSGRLKLVEGSLTEAPKMYEAAVQEKNIPETPFASAEKAKEEVLKCPEEAEIPAPAETPVSEDVEKAEEPVTAAKPKRTRRKKNTEPAAEPFETVSDIQEITEE